jgi:hypothetical protein
MRAVATFEASKGVVALLAGSGLLRLWNVASACTIAGALRIASERKPSRRKCVTLGLNPCTNRADSSASDATRRERTARNRCKLPRSRWELSSGSEGFDSRWRRQSASLLPLVASPPPGPSQGDHKSELPSDRSRTSTGFEPTSPGIRLLGARTPNRAHRARSDFFAIQDPRLIPLAEKCGRR